jgi:uncharacterized alkaline shock family protein YloU
MYSNIGNFFLSENVITEIVTCLAIEQPNIVRVQHIQVISSPKGLTLDLEATLVYGSQLHKELECFQQLAKEKVEYMTGFTIDRINILAKRLELEKNIH